MSYSVHPLLEHLPYEGYQNNDTVIALCAAVDSDYKGMATILEGMVTALAPDTAPDSYLDFIAYLVGFSGKYWDNGWSVSVKRAFITQGHHLWRTKGTEQCIRDVMAIHGITYDLWQQTNLMLPFPLPGTFSKKAMKFYIRLPLTYARTSPQWQEAKRTLTNFKPAVVGGAVSYQGFILGYSHIGDPLFKL